MTEPTVTWRADAAAGVRSLAPITAAGALLGVVVGGVGGRVAMSLLALLNPTAAGISSDDGFTIGQFTLFGSLQLLGAGLQIGLIGAAVYAALRFLLLGPRWFQVGSMALGPGIVVGALVVDTEGVDFTLLDPAWLGALLFVLIPAVYGGLMCLLSERWLGRERWFARAPLPRVGAVLLLWIPVLPLLPVIVAAWAVVRLARRWRVTGAALAHPVLRLACRAALVGVFVLAVGDLAGDLRVLAR